MVSRSWRGSGVPTFSDVLSEVDDILKGLQVEAKPKRRVKPQPVVKVRPTREAYVPPPPKDPTEKGASKGPEAYGSTSWGSSSPPRTRTRSPTS